MHNFKYIQNKNLESSIIESTKTSVSSSDVFGVSITIISLIIILTPLAISESDPYGLKDFVINLIDFDKKPANESKTITKIINGESHSITIHLEIEQKAHYRNIY